MKIRDLYKYKRVSHPLLMAKLDYPKIFDSRSSLMSIEEADAAVGEEPEEALPEDSLLEERVTHPEVTELQTPIVPRASLTLPSEIDFLSSSTSSPSIIVSPEPSLSTTSAIESEANDKRLRSPTLTSPKDRVRKSRRSNKRKNQTKANLSPERETPSQVQKRRLEKSKHYALPPPPLSPEGESKRDRKKTKSCTKSALAATNSSTSSMAEAGATSQAPIATASSSSSSSSSPPSSPIELTADQKRRVVEKYHAPPKLSRKKGWYWHRYTHPSEYDLHGHRNTVWDCMNQILGSGGADLEKYRSDLIQQIKSRLSVSG